MCLLKIPEKVTMHQIPRKEKERAVGAEIRSPPQVLPDPLALTGALSVANSC